MTSQKLRMVRGDDRTLTVTLTQDGVPFTLAAGDLLWMTAKHDPADTDAAAVFQLTSTGGDIVFTAGTAEATITLAASHTASLSAGQHLLVWDVQWRRAGLTATVAEGTLVVAPDVTRA